MAETETLGALAGHDATAPNSARWPWARAGLAGFVATMLPFTWVLQIDGCTQTVADRSTGLDLVREVPLGLADLGLALFLMTLALATPRWSGLVRHASTRLGLHVAGLVATAALAFQGLSLVFGRVEVRAIQPAGFLVLAALVACVVDAIARTVLGAMEWSAERTTAAHARDG